MFKVKKYLLKRLFSKYIFTIFADENNNKQINTRL